MSHFQMYLRFDLYQQKFQVFSLFTRSMFLVSGSLKSEGTQEHILEQFEGLGYPCPPTNNPADFVIRVLSAGSTSEVAISTTNLASTLMMPRHRRHFTIP